MHSTCVDHKINKYRFTLVENQQMGIGKIVRQLRKERGWKLEELSRRSGVAVGTISALEVRDSVRSEYASQLAHGLGVPVETLLGTPDLPALGGGVVVGGPAPLDAIIDGLRGYLRTSGANREAVAALLAAVAKDPDDERAASALHTMLDAGFAQPARKVA